MNKLRIKQTLGILYITTFIGLAFVAWNYFKAESSQQRSVETYPSPVQERTGDNPIPAPKFASEYSSDKPTTNVQITTRVPLLPTTAKVYEIKNATYNDEQITKLASNLGFTKKPTIYDSKIEGKIHIYSQDEVGTMRVEAKQRIIDYKSVKKPDESIQRTTNQQQIQDRAKEYFSSLQIIDTNTIEVKNFATVNIDEPGFGTPNAINIQFIKKINNVPLLAATYGTGIATITLNNKDEVIAFYIDDIGDLEDKGDYALKDENELKETVNEASIQSITGGKITSEYDTSSFAVESVGVSQIELAYVQDANQEILQPLFVLRGRALLNDKTYAQAVLYLQALSKRQ